MLVIVLAACAQPKRPEGILPEKQMVRTLIELYIVEEKAGSLGLPYDSIKKAFPLFSDQVFEKTGVPDSAFRKSMDYYIAYPEQLERIYTAVLDSLNLRVQKVSAEKKPDVVSE